MADLFTDEQLAAALHLPTVDATFAEQARARATAYLRTELGVEFATGIRTLTERVPRSRTYVGLLGPLTSVTSVTVNGAALTVTDDYEATNRGVLCPAGFGQDVTTAGDWCSLVVVYVAGFATIPAELTEWALVLGTQAFNAPTPGVRSSTLTVEGVSEATTFDTDTSAGGLSLPDAVLRSLRKRYGSDRRHFGSVLLR